MAIITGGALFTEQAPMTPSVLIVDDDLPSLRVITRSLTMVGYRPCTARDGNEALAMIASDPPHLVITDLLMPHLDGRALITHLQQHHANLPVIAFSASRPVDGLAGVPFLIKPFTHAELVAAVQKMLPIARDLSAAR